MYNTAEIYGSMPGANRYANFKQPCYRDFLDFCNILNLHPEPSLKTTSAGIYHASNVLQTRIIDTNPYSASLIENLTLEEKKQFNRLKNQDAINKEYQLALAERFHLKACGFVHAMAPSIFVKAQQTNLWARRNKLLNLIKGEMDFNKRRLLEIGLKALNDEIRVTGSHYGTYDFLHLRFWFFDLDYPEFIRHEEILDNIEELGLLPYVNCMVQTSPTKYHIYMKSEMICTEDQVKNWPTALTIGELTKTVDSNYLKTLVKERPRYTGSDWFKVAKRGVPSINRLEDIPIPIPEEATLHNGLYVGDKKVYESYLQSWHKIAKVLQADTCTYDATRIAQLPGYSNPKNLYQARIVYHNRSASVLTTKVARTNVVANIEKYTVLTGNKTIYEHALSQNIARINRPIRCNIDKAGIDTVRNGSDIRYTKGLANLKRLEKMYGGRETKTEIEVIKNSTKSVDDRVAIKKFNRANKARNMPIDYVDYVRVHGLVNEVIWDKDITGHSNRMLLMFSRYVKKHINLDDEYQRRKYFDTIIRPYFASRHSKDLKKATWENDFYERFLILCKTAKVDLEKFLSELELKGKDEINLNNVKVIFEEQLEKDLGRTSEVFREVGHKKLRRIIYDAVGRSGHVVDKKDYLEIEFFIPHIVMQESIGGRYRDLLRVYESTGNYKVDYKYQRPYIDEIQVWQKGQCKKHFMYLKCEKEKIFGKEKLYKKRISKAESKAESSSLLQEIMRKKLEKKEKLEDVSTG